MASNTSISLGEHSAFVDQQLQTGRYGSVSEVIQAGLKLLEEHEAKVAALRGALIEGEQSGEPVEFDHDAFFKKMHR
jgi:antitoxin ParD1/3/4